MFAHGWFLWCRCRRLNSPWTCWAPTLSSLTCPSSSQSFSPAQKAPARQAAAARAPGQLWRGGSTGQVCLTKLWANCHGSKILTFFFLQNAVCCTVQFSLLMYWAHNFSYADVKWDYFFSSDCTDRNLLKRNPHPIKINGGNNIHAANLWWRMITIIGQPIKACRLHVVSAELCADVLLFLRCGNKQNSEWIFRWIIPQRTVCSFQLLSSLLFHT